MKKQKHIIMALILTMATTGFGQMVVKNSSGTAVMTVKNNGNVGIGTNDPVAKLHVVGSQILTSAAPSA